MPYPSLSIPAPRRLAMLRDEAAKPRPHRSEPMSWRDARYATLRDAPSLGQGLNDDAPVWYLMDAEELHRDRDAHEILNLDHTGWYTDADESGGNDLAIGIVARLPHGRFLAGYRLTMNGERVYFPAIYSDEKDAAHAADEHARIIGEEESEHQRQFREAQELQDDASSKVAKLARLRLDHSAHIVAGGPAHRLRAAGIRRQAASLVEELRAIRKRLAGEFADFI